MATKCRLFQLFADGTEFLGRSGCMLAASYCRNHDCRGEIKESVIISNLKRTTVKILYFIIFFDSDVILRKVLYKVDEINIGCMCPFKNTHLRDLHG